MMFIFEFLTLIGGSYLLCDLNLHTNGQVMLIANSQPTADTSQ